LNFKLTHRAFLIIVCIPATHITVQFVYEPKIKMLHTTRGAGVEVLINSEEYTDIENRFDYGSVTIEQPGNPNSCGFNNSDDVVSFVHFAHAGVSQRQMSSLLFI